MIVINPKQQQAVSGTIISKKDGGVYRIETRSGKIIQATASLAWSVGATVTVLSGEIIGSAGRVKNSNVYQV